LSQGRKHCGTCLELRPRVSDIPDNTHDTQWLACVDEATNGAPHGEECPRGTLAENCHPRCSHTIVVSKRPPLKDRHSERTEVTRSNLGRPDFYRESVTLNQVSGKAAAKGNANGTTGSGCHSYPRSVCNGVDERKQSAAREFDSSRTILRIQTVDHGTHRHDQHIAGIKAQVDAHNAREARREQTCADEEHYRQPQL
jgi:hypothetical protein